MIKKIIILGVCSILCSVSASNVCVDAGLGTTDGFLTHPTNCSMYISCYGGYPYEVTCPDGFNFNPEALKCDPKYVCLENNCPLTGVVRLPVDGVCDQYVLCIGGKAYLRDCGDGLAFNATLGMCVDASESGCVTNECDKSQGHPQGFVDPFNCTVFYICDENFDPIRFECPNGTVFDQDLLDCVKGECSSTTTSDDSTTTTAAADTTTTTTAADTTTTTTAATTTTTDTTATEEPTTEEAAF
ncbi:chitin-binding domain protein cbd-1-like isoform X2 [Topomyia yanbarensis]|uniref:chitin-binding domain protein cbd-1-like isoform X2 n=1 Tax=Topomyia yanbarensis TaxID=2498891 RepID=UPI00273BC9C8|nr:chitin-binding domain protein cbd-1-like isoform X2 [Topomyia yanbarensis]